MKRVIAGIVIAIILLSIAPIEGRRPYSNDPVIAGHVMYRPHVSSETTISGYVWYGSGTLLCVTEVSKMGKEVLIRERLD